MLHVTSCSTPRFSSSRKLTKRLSHHVWTRPDVRRARPRMLFNSFVDVRGDLLMRVRIFHSVACSLSIYILKMKDGSRAMTDSEKSTVICPHIAVGKGNPAQVALMFWNGVTAIDGWSKSAGHWSLGAVRNYQLPLAGQAASVPALNAPRPSRLRCFDREDPSGLLEERLVEPDVGRYQRGERRIARRCRSAGRSRCPRWR